MSDQRIYLSQPPPLLNGLALLLWGWQTGFIVYSFIMALTIELPRVFTYRLHISDREFNYIADISTLLFLSVTVYLFFEHSFEGIFLILATLPFIFYLLLLAQSYNTREDISLSVLFISLRKQTDKDKKRLNIAYPYFFICIIAASSGNHHRNLFYFFAILLVVTALWSLRPSRDRKIPALIILTTTAFLAYPLHTGLQRLQGLAESKMLAFFEKFIQENMDSNRVTTAIGSVGRLKFSDSIRLRMNTYGEKLEERILLQEATYGSYGYGAWTNRNQTFRIIEPGVAGTQWPINNINPANSNNWQIHFKFNDKKDILPLPYGILFIDNFAAVEMDYSESGSILVEYKPGWASYQTVFKPGDILLDMQNPRDNLTIPGIYRDDLERIAAYLQIDNNLQSPYEKLKTIKRFFANNFSYSLTQSERYPRGRYLSKFLFETRRGHCEYFATATALLLRAAGIPARYAIGYAVDEYSELEKRYLARGRHAHAWVLAWIDNDWRIVDTTPAVWAELEHENRSDIEPLYDFFSWLFFNLFSAPDRDNRYDQYLIIFLILAGFSYVLIRFKRNTSIRRKTDNNDQQIRTVSLPVLDKLLSHLERMYYRRNHSETLWSWTQKISVEGLNQIISDYYEFRFDPCCNHAGKAAEIEKFSNDLLEKIQDYQKQ